MEKASELLRKKLNCDFPPILDQIQLTVTPWCEGVHASKSFELSGIVVDVVKATFRIGVVADYYYHKVDPPKRTYNESGVVMVHAVPSGTKTKHGKEKPRIFIADNSKDLVEKRIGKPKLKSPLFGACRAAFHATKKATADRERSRTRKKRVYFPPVNLIIRRRASGGFQFIFSPITNVIAISYNEDLRGLLCGAGICALIACEKTLETGWQNFIKHPPRKRRQTLQQRKKEGEQRTFSFESAILVKRPKSKQGDKQESTRDLPPTVLSSLN